MTLFSFALIKDKRVGIVLFKKATRVIRSFKKKQKSNLLFFCQKRAIRMKSKERIPSPGKRVILSSCHTLHSSEQKFQIWAF